VVVGVDDRVPALFVTVGYFLAAGCAVAIALGVALVKREQLVLGLLGRLLGWLPDNVKNFVLQQMQRIAVSLAALNNVQRTLQIGFNTIVQWFLMGVCIYLSLVALDIDIPLSGAFLVLIATVFGISLPTSPGYVGNIQLAFTLALTPYGIDPATAFAASLFYHALAYGAVVVVGVACLQKLGYGVSDLRCARRESESLPDA